MTTLRERIEARRAALLSERAIAEAARGSEWEAEKRYDEVSMVIAGTDPGFYEITVTGTLQDAAHIAAQDPAATIARIDRELAGIDADLALLDSAVPYLESWGWRDVRANLYARYPEEVSA